MDSRLPVELYRDIVGHVEKHDLISLSTTSRNLGYEAERILYRELTFNLDVDKLPLNARIVDHVLSLRILSIRVDDSSILPTLQSVKNLKNLHLGFFEGLVGSFFYHCPSDAPFQLQHLSIEGHPGDPGFKAFIQSQRQITRFIWNPNPLDFPGVDLSPTDFPALTSLSCAFVDTLVTLLSDARIHHLRHKGNLSTIINQLTPGTVLTTVRALAVGTLTDMDLVAAIFPQLRYLEASSFHSPNLNFNFLVSVAQFTNLRKLKLPLSRRIAFDARFPPKIFDHIESLKIVEVWSSKRIDGESVYSGVIFQRGISPRACYSEDEDEWWKW